MTFKPVENPIAIFDLESPIQYLGVPIDEIAVRAPTAGDIFRAGNPVTKFDLVEGSVVFDETKALSMLSRLSGIPIEGSLERMSANDTMSCFYGIARFFIPGLRTKKAEPSPSSEKPDEPPAS